MSNEQLALPWIAQKRPLRFNPHILLEEPLAAQKQIKGLQSQHNERRRSLFDAQNEVDKQRERLIANIESKLTQRVDLKPLFTLRWRLQ